MAQYPQRFCDEVIVEFVGVTNAQQESPFWNGVGRPFFNMEYDQAEHYCSTRSKAFIGEIMPASPIYEALIPEPARQVIGAHDTDYDDVLAVALAEGFHVTPYIDIFDAGPCFACRRQHLHSVAASTLCVVDARARAGDVELLVSNVSGDAFFCTYAVGNVHSQRVRLSPESKHLLQPQAGDTVRAVAAEVGVC